MKTKFLVKEEIEEKKKALVPIVRYSQIMLVVCGAMITTFTFCARMAWGEGHIGIAGGLIVCLALTVFCVFEQLSIIEKTIKADLNYIWNYCDIAFESLRLKKELTLDEIIDEYEQHVPKID